MGGKSSGIEAVGDHYPKNMNSEGKEKLHVSMVERKRIVRKYTPSRHSRFSLVPFGLQ